MGTAPSRNAPCPCGSGRKYKHCCLTLGAVQPAAVAPGVAAAGTPRQLLVLQVVLALVSVAVFFNTLSAEFTLDDNDVIAGNYLVADLHNVPLIFKTHYWGFDPDATDSTLYRPLTVSSYAVNYAVDGLRPWGYHAVNILLHALVCALLFALVCAWSGDRWLAFATGLVFAVHPVHVEAVANVVGRAEILALLGILLCLFAYDRASRLDKTAPPRAVWGWTLLSGLAYLAGMLSKEIAFIAPAFILLYEWLNPGRRFLFRGCRQALIIWAGYIAAAGCFFALRANAVEGHPVTLGFIGVSAVDRALTGFRFCLEYVGLLLFPAQLSASYWITKNPVARSLFEPGVLAAVALAAAGAIFVLTQWRRFPVACLGIGWFVVALFPISNIPFSIGVMKAERILYTASAGFILAVVALSAPLWRRPAWRIPAGVVLVGIVVALGARTWVRNRDWHDNFALAQATLAVSPTSPDFNRMMSELYHSRGDNQRSREFWQRAWDNTPASVSKLARAKALFNLGNLDKDDGRFADAIADYRRSLELAPNRPDAMNNLAVALLRAKNLPEAALIFRQLIALQPEHPGAYINLLSLLADSKRGAEALPIAEEAVKRFPHSAGIQWNAAEVFRQCGREAEARKARERVRTLEPTGLKPSTGAWPVPPPIAPR